MKNYYKIELDPKILIYALGIFLLVTLGWEIRSVLIMLFIAFILNAGLRPLVDALEARKIPRMVSIVIIYLSALVIVVGLLVITANQFISQAVHLINALPEIYTRVVEFLQINAPIVAGILPLQSIQTELSQFVNDALKSGIVSNQSFLDIVSQALGTFGSVATLFIQVFTVVMVSVFMLQRKDNVYEGILGLLPDDISVSARYLLRKVQSSLGAWLIGQVLLMILIGVLIYFIVLIPGIFDPNYTLSQYALPIAIFAGLLEALPNLGPIITLLFAVALALGTSGLPTVVYVVIAFTAAQTLEANFIVPILMKRAVGIDPILTMLGIIAAFEVAGPIGAFVIVPVIAIAQIAIVEVAKEHKRVEKMRPKLVQ